MRTFKDEEAALEFINSIPWGTAAGTTKDPKMAIKYAQAGAKIVHFGSITWNPRIGNPGDNFYFDSETGNSINALGIPNKGFNEYLPILAGLREEVNALGSELWVSISAGDYFVPEEYAEMTAQLLDQDAADIVAGNMSCPNIIADGKRKPVVCFDPAAFAEGVAAMSCNAQPSRLAIKLAPITEASILEELVGICLDNQIQYIEAANTVGNCYFEKVDGTPAITMKRGGGAGRMLDPIIKGMITMIRPLLDTDRSQHNRTPTKLVVMGSILNGAHAYEMLRLGADGFEFNTALSARGGDPKVITEMIYGADNTPGLVDLLVERGLPR